VSKSGERRNTLLDELKGLPAIPPHGGWSLLLDTSPFGITSQKLSERLLKEAKIATTSMVGWGETADKYVRFVFSNEPQERLIGLGKKIKKILGT
jgi:aspartate/methionine/tyrosine aminotransferase